MMMTDTYQRICLIARRLALITAALVLSVNVAAVAQPALTDDPAPVSRVGLNVEIVEADVSSRSIAVTSGFTGQEIIVFGSIHNSRQTSADERYYDVVVVVEGIPTPLVLRRKSNVAGLWMNTTSINFDLVPSFYALSSTGPLDKIAAPDVFEDQGIGFDHIRMTPRHPVAKAEMKIHRAALVRLKKKDKVYVQEQSGVTFIGRSLFRSSVMLPANIPVGLLQARVYLFHKGALLSTYNAQLQMEREGLERWLHDLAKENGFLYGLLAILTAVSAGLLASEVSRRRAG